MPDSGISQKERARQTGVGRDTQQKLDRLARDFPALHDEVKAENLSVHRASIHAGFIKDISAVDRLKRACLLNVLQRLRFPSNLLTVD